MQEFLTFYILLTLCASALGAAPRTTFLEDVSPEAKAEYLQLSKRKDLSRSELKKMQRKWGKDHEVKDKVDAYLIEKEKYDKIVHDKFASLLERLPKLGKEFLELKENQDLSREETNYKFKIMISENYLEYKMLSYAWKKLRKGEDKPKKGSRKRKVTKKGLIERSRNPVI
ncbi:unnamed protein product [Cylicocyclus nassatus]|uniref:SXP/RAL-2 family protein Ani s 5-like cation-binding domain-containing protein n=1 Tax=Cylicocyclus nassatus TaxID=53992 RepID=A0AA36M8V2_CYLNA|nr:unnamed protein product [Cylicocyclus nassatus]